MQARFFGQIIRGELWPYQALLTNTHSAWKTPIGNEDLISYHITAAETISQPEIVLLLSARATVRQRIITAVSFLLYKASDSNNKV